MVLGWVGAAAAGAVVAIAAPRAAKHLLRRARNDHRRRPQLWNRFYALDWGETATNNYGFAPAEGKDPQRFQHQMYRELFKRLVARKPLTDGLRLLEVSCGRGGGLQAFLAEAPGAFDATGLDVAASAVAYCRAAYGEQPRLNFVEGDALSLPFPDASFDVVLNVEASNDYGDRARFFREAARVLKRGGVFLYADSFRRRRVADLEAEIAAAGFDARFDDIGANVAEACRQDSPRRIALIRKQAPLIGRLLFGTQLHNYAAVEGSRKYQAFASGRRRYLMTAAVRT